MWPGSGVPLAQLECRMRLVEKAGRISFDLRPCKCIRLAFAFALPQNHEVPFPLGAGPKNSRDLELSLWRSILHQIDWYSANRKVDRIQRG